MNSKILLPLLLTGGLTSVASANGFVINEHDAAATGRGNAVTATDDSPSSIVYNPGGIAVGAGTNVEVSGTMVDASGSYTDPAGVKTDTTSSPAVLPAVFVTSRVTDMISVGVGFHLPFGLAIKWPASSPQNEVIKEQSLRTYFITPVVGVNLSKFVPGLSFGGGVDIVPATVELKRAVVFGDVVGEAHLGGSGVGVGGRVGVQFKPAFAKGLSLGAMWRSKVKIDFDGTGDFDIDPSVRGQLPPDGDIATSVTLPQSVAGGVAYRPVPELALELDAVWMGWSSFKELKIMLPGGSESVAVENYKNTVSLRVGAEYGLKAVPLSIRAGYVYDPTPIPATTVSAQLPDVDRHVVTAGGTYALTPSYGVSAAVLAVLPVERDTAPDLYMPIHKGTYGVSALVLSATFNGRFGAK
ncbi:MAG: outer membrane protein transport protein [Proteobacteria bacterium]|nr:outer membrane protein transport protein [Pseudomonadota bacterium]